MSQHADKSLNSSLRSTSDAPWVEKFRPKSLDEVAAHKEIIDTSEDMSVAMHAGPVSKH